MKPTIYKSWLLGQYVCRDLEASPSDRGIAQSPEGAYKAWASDTPGLAMRMVKQVGNTITSTRTDPRLILPVAVPGGITKL